MVSIVLILLLAISIVLSWKNEDYDRDFFDPILIRLANEYGAKAREMVNRESWNRIKKKYHLKVYPGAQEIIYNVIKEEYIPKLECKYDYKRKEKSDK